MLSLFTKYLVQFGRVSIPHVGSFELITHAPQLDVADKALRPPFYTASYEPKDALNEHQHRYFSRAFQYPEERTEAEISSFGARLKRRIEKEPFCWNGFGTLRYQSGRIYFEPLQIVVPSLNAVPAQKIIRENVQHQMLVGDQEMNSDQVSGMLSRDESRRSYDMIIGWIILILIVLAILAILFLDNFHPFSSGTRWQQPGF